MAKQRTKAEVKEFLLQELENILSAPGEKTRDRLKAIEMYGIEHGMFVEQKKLNIDIAGIVRHLSDGQLTAASQGQGLLPETRKEDILDVEVVRGTPPNDNRDPDDPDLLG